MEGAYQRMTALKKAQWERNNAFYTNRGFSRDVRKVRSPNTCGWP